MEVNCVWIFDGCISWREDVARKRPIGRSGHFSSVVTHVTLACTSIRTIDSDYCISS